MTKRAIIVKNTNSSKYSWRRILPIAGFIIGLVSLLIFVTRPASASGSFTIAPPPSWVESVTLPQNDTVDSSSEAAYLLLDHQIRVSNGTVERYERRAKKLLSAAGLSDAAQIEIEFEPSYQQLTIHYIHILRGTQRIDALKPQEIKTIQQEDELDQQLYNGTKSALIVLDDVREGDVIDYAYTITGNNPVMAGRYVSTFWLADTKPVKKLRWRLLWPAQRQIYYKLHGTGPSPEIHPIDTGTEYQWELNDVAAVQVEDNAPSWYEPLSRVRVSEFATWGDVVNWALPLYKPKSAPSPALARQIEQWRLTLPSNEERLMAALQFVQDKVRYTGIEMGPYSHMPNQPSLVFERRFGDCKDKSLLLATILNALGIEAFPALANTNAQQTVADFQPSPYAFNHVIVQAMLDGKTYWLDSTITLQRGSLSSHYNPEYGRALVLRDGNGELADIPKSAPSAPTIVIKEVYNVESNQQAAQFDVTTTYHDKDADEMRYQLARTSLAELGRSYINYYANIDSDIEQLATPKADDDPNANIITITERYRIPRFWNDGGRQFGAYRIDEEMTKPNITRRTAPLALTNPVHIAESIEVHMAAPLSIQKDSGVVSDDFIRFEFHSEMIGNTMKLDYAYRSLAGEVPASQVAKHLAVREKVRNRLSYEIKPGGSSSDEENSSSEVAGLVVIGLIFGPFLVFGAIKGVRSRQAGKRSSEFKDKFQIAPGTAPQVAITIADESELASQVGSLRCSCGERYNQPGAMLNQERFTYDGRRLILVQLMCERCRRSCDMYFAPPLVAGQR